ncbi:MAG TPA: protein phosphatase 2C domain-containing protein [Gemmatimonadales bacterium]|nr:protein phosphatase 2C domain-containing protein [Gemmatimonadales bacterium]
MTAAPGVRVDAKGLTDIGKKRKANEDHFVVLTLRKAVEVKDSSLTDPGVFDRLRGPEGWLFVVADGVGGIAGGALASETAVTALAEFLGQATGCFNRIEPEREHELLEELESAVHAAHRKIMETYGGGAARGRNASPGPATTLTMALLVWPRAYIVHVGDSRAFYLRKGRLRQLTRDQTTGEYMVNMGAWTEEQAAAAPVGGTLISAVGADEMTPAVGLVDLQPGDTLMLCTDGLTRHVSDERITELLGRSTDAAAASRELVDEALAGGGHDNITVIVARMG